MKKLFSVLSLALVGGVLASQPVLAQGTQQPKPKTEVKKVETKKVEVKKPEMKKDTASHKQMADTIKKGQTAAKHSRKHKSTHKPAEKKPGSEKPSSK